MLWWHGSGNVGWGWMVFGAVWMVVFWGAVFALAYWLIRGLAARPSAGERPTADDIARERYARGDITREQLEEIRRNLRT